MIGNARLPLDTHDDLGVEKDAPIALRFRMDKARIYGVEFQ